MADEHVVVATTLTTFAMGGDFRVWGHWLLNAHEIRNSIDGRVEFFVAIEMDARGIEPFRPLTDAIEHLGGTYFTYTLDDGRTEVTTTNRQRHLTMGENLCSDYAGTVGATHMLFVAADCCPPVDVLPKLLAVNNGLAGAECTTYCLSGPEVDGYGFPVQEHEIATAACLLIAREVFMRLRWRHDGLLSDDPAYCRDARELLGVPALVRKDCVALHYPEAIPAIEDRGYDLTVVR